LLQARKKFRRQQALCAAAKQSRVRTSDYLDDEARREQMHLKSVKDSALKKEQLLFQAVQHQSQADERSTLSYAMLATLMSKMNMGLDDAKDLVQEVFGDNEDESDAGCGNTDNEEEYEISVRLFCYVLGHKPTPAPTHTRLFSLLF